MGISDVTREYRWGQKVDRSGECWLWTGWRTAAGYGMFRWSTDRRITAHRAAYMLFVGPIPDASEVDHLCRVRACVNPTHLEAVSLSVNRRRRQVATVRATVNGRKTKCGNGHPLSGPNVRIEANGARTCRACRRDTQRRFRQRMAAT